MKNQNKKTKKPLVGALAGGGKRTLMHHNRTGVQNNFIAPKAYSNPFRISDERMVFGKYKGCKLQDVDISYIRWMYDNLDMDSTRKSILKEKIENAD